MRDGGARHIEGTGQIDAYHGVPIGRIELLHRPGRATDAGAVDEHVQTAHAFGRIADHCRDCRTLAHRAVQSQQPRQFARRALQCGRIDVADVNERAVPVEGAGNGLTDAGGAAGDEDLFHDGFRMDL